MKDNFSELSKAVLTCAGCGTKSTWAGVIDTWAIQNPDERPQKMYCMQCQSKMKIGWYDPKNKTA